MFRGSIFIVGSPINILSAHCTVILHLNDQTLATVFFFCLFLYPESCYIVLYFLPRRPLPLPTKCEIDALSSARTAPISISRCLHVYFFNKYSTHLKRFMKKKSKSRMNVYFSAAKFISFCRSVEQALESR